MLRIVKQGAAWSVMRDGALVRDGESSGVHATEDSAVPARNANSSKTPEHVDPMQWYRRYSNGWLSTVILNEDGRYTGRNLAIRQRWDNETSHGHRGGTQCCRPGREGCSATSMRSRVQLVLHT